MVESNGTLQLTGNTAFFTSGCNPLPNANYERTLFPYYDDLRTDDANTPDCANFPGGCGIFTSVTGSAPNREFHIEWRTGYFGRTGTANFEVRLHESSTDINVVYGATVDNGSEETSGIQSSSAGPATQFSCGEPTLTNGLEVIYSCAGGGTPTPTPTPTCTPTEGVPGPWSQATPYPITNVRYGWAQTATHFYVFGGVSDGTRVNDVYRMDIATGAWQPRAPMPFTSEAPTCALMESTGLVYCTEGDTGSGFASYNIATDTLGAIGCHTRWGSLRLCLGCFQWQGICSGRHHRPLSARSRYTT